MPRKSIPLSPEARRVEACCRRYGMLRPGWRVGVAASGGADSTALLCLLLELAPAWGLQLSLLHVQHHLRSEAEADAGFTRALADRFGLEWRRFDLAPPASSANLEQWARRERYDCFRRYLAEGGAEVVATGHHRDDQAETVLLRLLRGAGPRGLAGIWPVTLRRPPEPGAALRPAIIRPLLELGRSELRAYLRARGQAWREDGSNRSPRFLRNRIRLELLPWLEREFNPAIALALSRLAELARAEELDWEARVAPLAAGIWRPGPAGEWRAETPRLAALPLALRRRVVRSGLETARGARLPAAGNVVESICRWIESAPAASRPRRCHLAGLRIMVTPRRIALQSLYPAEKPAL